MRNPFLSIKNASEPTISGEVEAPISVAQIILPSKLIRIVCPAKEDERTPVFNNIGLLPKSVIKEDPSPIVAELKVFFQNTLPLIESTAYKLPDEKGKNTLPL